MDKKKSVFGSKRGRGLVEALLIFSMALIVRLMFVSSAQEMPSSGYLTFDLTHYHNLAEAIALGSYIGHEAVWLPPLYQFVLAGIYLFFSNAIAKVFVIQAIIGSISAVLVYLIAVKLYSRKVAFTAGIVTALYGTLIYFDIELLPVTLTIALLLTSVYSLASYVEKSGIWKLVCSGIALGLAGAAKPETLLFAPAALWWLLRSQKTSSGRRMIPAALLAAVVVIVTIPFANRNQARGGENVPYLTYLGVRFAIANQADADGKMFSLPGSFEEKGQTYANAIEATNRSNAREVPLDEMGSYWFGKAIDYIISNPLEWIKLELQKVVLLISGYEIPTDRPLHYIASHNFPLSALLWDKVISFPFGLLLPFALLAPLNVVTGRHALALVVGFFISMAAAILLFNVFAYQRVLVAPVIITFGAAGFWGLIEVYGRGDYKKFYRGLIVLAIGLVVVNGISSLTNLSSKVNSDFEGKMFEASALALIKNLDEAEQTFQEASRIDPRSPRPQTGLGNIYARQGKDSLAILYFSRAYGLDPSDHRPLQGVAAMLKRSIKINELNLFLVKVLRDHPKANWAYHEYAALHLKLEEYTQAADIFERAFQADSTDFDALFRKAESYLTADMRGEAEQEFKRYLELMPNSVDAHANLGQVYARQRRFGEALAEFGYARNVQPGNPAVYFNLASLHYQMEDMARAHSYLDTARAIDTSFPGLDRLHEMIDSAAAMNH